MEIRKGTHSDLLSIMKFVRHSVEMMDLEGNDQWTSDYPTESDFKQDIENETLFVAVLNHQIVGCVTIDQQEGEKYDSIAWREPEQAFFVFHRLAVDPEIRGQGIAGELLNFIEDYAKQQKISYIKTDTYSLNEKAQGLFVKQGYEKVGIISIEGKDHPFFCYDKILSK